MPVIDQKITDSFAAYNGDNMEVLPKLKASCIGFSVYSPAFPELYQYSNDPRDMSNCTSYKEGMEQYQFIVDQVHRVTMPGRLTAVHCMDLKSGSRFQKDFPGDIVRAHEKAGFNFFCRVTIWKDPWLIARRTRMRSLMHKMIVEDSSKCRVAGADYVLIFTKSGENPKPIENPTGLSTYAGEEQIPESLAEEFSNFTGDQRKNYLSHWIWRRYASPVWMDIRSGRLLPYKPARETDEEKHVCPLQLDVIERALTLWSAPGDTVLTPFMGVGSEVYCALNMGRKAVGIELKSSYYRQALRNIEAAVTGSDDEQQSLLKMGAQEQADEEEQLEEDTIK